jgi:hypothetical protein
MKIIAKEKGAVHVTTVIKDGDRMAVLVTLGETVEHAETVGCFDLAETQSFVDEASTWLTSQTRSERPRHRSGEHVAVRPRAAILRATG